MMAPDSRFETRAVHAGLEDLVDLGVHVPPIDLSSTYPMPSVEVGGDSYEHLAHGGKFEDGNTPVYQRLWHPGIARFERALANLEGAESAVAFASGMATFSAMMIAIVSAGKPNVVAVRPVYGGSDTVLQSGILGNTVTWATVDTIAESISEDTGLVFVESPANPTLELLDIAEVVRAAGDVPVLVDNTFATPVLQRPLELGATLVMHSATKYLGGHGDVMAGVVATNEEWATRLRPVRALTGANLHPLSAYLLHRGLRTLPLRMRAQQDTAAELARRLAERSDVARTMYPGLPGSDPKGLIGTQMAGGGAMVSIDLGSYDVAARFLESLRLFVNAVSLGGVDSLATHAAALTHRPVPDGAKPSQGVVRMSIGLEHVEDLWADLVQALDAAH